MNKKDGKYIPDDIKGLIDDIQRIKEDVYSRKISHSYDFEKRTDTESLRSRADGDIERSTKWLRKYLTSEETLAPLERTGQHKKKRMDSVIKYAPIANGEDDFELIDDGDDSPVIYAPDPALLYRKDYTDACLWADPEIVPKNELSKRNLSQLIYEMTGVLLPRKGSLWTDYSKLLHLSRIKKQQCIPYEMLIRYLKSQRERSLMPTEEKSTAATKASDAEQIRKFKEDIKRLNTQLRETHDKKNAERKRANQAESQNERYKVEIAELRSMLFDRTAFAREEKKTRLDFPYTAKHKITIFGGHEVWLYSIKPLLSGVRFVGPDERPNVSMIINSEVIWLQTNVMAHSYYNKIVDTARMHNIPVKYFSFSGAEKCAEQLALDDMEVSK